MKRLLIVALMLLMCAAAPPEKAQRTVELEAPVIEREPDPKVPGGEIWKASGGVTLTTPDVNIKADSMIANVGKDRTMEQVRAVGGVVIKGSRKTADGIEQRLNATCNEAIYFMSEERLLLSGNVRGTVVEVERERTVELTSDKAHLWLREDRMMFERAKVKFTEPEKPAPKQE